MRLGLGQMGGSDTMQSDTQQSSEIGLGYGGFSQASS